MRKSKSKENQNINELSYQELLERYNQAQEFIRTLEAAVSEVTCSRVEDAFDEVFEEALFYGQSDLKDSYYIMRKLKALWRKVREEVGCEPNQHEIECSNYSRLEKNLV